ncbi:DUF3509 domain-containing protein [Pseudomonas sp. UL073]|uniref:DUF3509 domain-containing protein n=1 Tax=Zestomonas insulae TaxID=2809017 RepID=A0ABS2IGE2_9GAMM|nr:DUF3509 domain-containing protein [Pseudomonas insulae]MBM7061830.1 DUF3509 domain-containing protein [Pseudomonas insulae]
MPLNIQEIIAAFPEFDTTCEKRPDGSHLLVLRKDGAQIKRVLPSLLMSAPLRTEWVVSAIRRDIQQDAGVTPLVAGLQSQSHGALPSYAHW